MLSARKRPMQEPSDVSVTQWIAELRVGQESIAQQELWGRYFNRLVALARQKLGNSPRAVEDEEDVAVSALGSFFVRVRDGQFPDLTDRNGLWPLLAKITACKAINQQKRLFAAKRGGLNQPTVASGNPDDSHAAIDFVDEQITPASLVELSEQCDAMLAELPEPVMRQIAEKKLAGYSTQEIAAELDVSPRTVERKTGLIRRRWAAWAKEVDGNEPEE